jgi:hypothetical protein
VSPLVVLERLVLEQVVLEQVVLEQVVLELGLHRRVPSEET